MTRRVLGLSALLALSGALLAPAGSIALPDRGALVGRVVRAATPLPSAQVWAFQLVDETLRLATTGPSGEFRFESLPAGLYKVIAFKRGFVPTVLLVARATAEAAQFVELDLSETAKEAAEASESFWALREQIPPDVLREMTLARAEESHEPRLGLAPSAAFQASMAAETGLQEAGDGAANAITGGEVNLNGRLGGVDLALTGDFLQLSPTGFVAGDGGSGQSTALALRLSAAGSDEVELRSMVSRLRPAAPDGGALDRELYDVRWKRPIGERSESALVAQYSEEEGRQAPGRLAPAAIPLASRTLSVEGAFRREFTEHGQLRAGLRYRERTDLPFGRAYSARAMTAVARNLEAFGESDLRLGERFDLEYGLTSGIGPAGTSVAPQAGLRMRLGHGWQGRLFASRRFEVSPADESGLREFLAVRVGPGDLCATGGSECYELALSHGEASDLASVSLAQRAFDRTLQLYFSDDPFDRAESLFLVPGDELPELRVVLSRRLFESIVARLESTVADGGGGVFLAADQQAYRNEIGYLLTSLDTRFVRTATGVLLAFRRLEQELLPMGARLASGPDSAVAVETLELTLSQDLNVFFDLAAQWAMRLNMELARGGSAGGSGARDEAVRRRLTTGVAVRF